MTNGLIDAFMLESGIWDEKRDEMMIFSWFSQDSWWGWNQMMRVDPDEESCWMEKLVDSGTSSQEKKKEVLMMPIWEDGDDDG